MDRLRIYLLFASVIVLTLSSVSAVRAQSASEVDTATSSRQMQIELNTSESETKKLTPTATPTPGVKPQTNPESISDRSFLGSYLNNCSENIGPCVATVFVIVVTIIGLLVIGVSFYQKQKKNP